MLVMGTWISLSLVASTPQWIVKCQWNENRCFVDGYSEMDLLTSKRDLLRSKRDLLNEDICVVHGYSVELKKNSKTK